MRKRILIVDDNADLLESRAEALEVSEYIVYTASSVEQARQILDTIWVHLAIIDIRLHENDEHDVSGLTLAAEPAYRPIQKIILTVYRDFEYVRKALRSVGGEPALAVDFVAKQEGVEAMLSTVARVLAENVRVNWDLHIVWDVPHSFIQLADLIVASDDAGAVAERAGELEDLFRILFADRSQIAIGRLLCRRDGLIILEAFAFANGEPEDQLVLCCGLRSEVRAERERYERFAPSASTTVAGRDTIVETTHFAASSYTLVGADLESVVPFRSWYQAGSSLEAALAHLFDVTLAAWHNRSHAQVDVSRCYELLRRGIDEPPASKSAALPLRITAMCARLRADGLAHIDVSPTRITIHEAQGLSFVYRSPVDMGFERLVNKLDLACGFIHGKLDADTILVDPLAHTWLVDCSHADVGVLLEDYISLEMTIRLELLEGASLETRHQLERRVLRDQPVPPSDDAPLASEFGHALNAIRFIRARAQAQLATSQPAYLGVLLYATLRYLLSYEPTQRYTRRRVAGYAHALLLAAMVYQELEANEQPRSGLPDAALQGLWINERTGEVWVEGSLRTLTAQELAMLRYLYDRADQLCPRTAILREAFTGPAGDQDMDEGRLNSAMSRLRIKLQNHAEHKYLFTVRGQGYRLLLRAR